MLTRPPSVVQAVEGYSASVEATFEGKIDTNLWAYWCITTEDKNYHCYSSSDHDDNYSVTIDGCPPNDPYCCNFTVTFTITSLTHNLSMAHLTSRVFWLQNASAFEPGNSVLGMNVILECFVVLSLLLQFCMYTLSSINGCPPVVNVWNFMRANLLNSLAYTLLALTQV